MNWCLPNLATFPKCGGERDIRRAKANSENIEWSRTRVRVGHVHRVASYELREVLQRAVRSGLNSTP